LTLFKTPLKRPLFSPFLGLPGNPQKPPFWPFLAFLSQNPQKPSFFTFSTFLGFFRVFLRAIKVVKMMNNVFFYKFF